jgi:hypothetical protein
VVLAALTNVDPAKVEAIVGATIAEEADPAAVTEDRKDRPRSTSKS